MRSWQQSIEYFLITFGLSHQFKTRGFNSVHLKPLNNLQNTFIVKQLPNAALDSIDKFSSKPQDCWLCKTVKS